MTGAARLVAALVVLCVGWVYSASPVQASVDAPVDAGDITIVEVNNRDRPVSQGDSNTLFSVRLPTGATCPGDSANDDWRVQSFIVPLGMDPGALEYGALRPIGDNLHALYGADTRPYIQAFLEQNGGSGQPGRILDAPPLSFGVFPAGLLPEGTYRIGVACTFFRDTAKFWDTEIVLSADPDVQPGELRWSVVDQAGSTTSAAEQDGSGNARWPFVAAASVAVAFIAFLARRRHLSLIKETVS